MAETDVFERRLRAALVRHTDDGPNDFDALGFARAVATKEPRRQGLGLLLGRRQALVPLVAWALLLVALLAVVSAGMLMVGSHLRQELPAVVPPIASDACPAGSTPDEPGPVDQLRPHGAQLAMAFDRRSGRLVAVTSLGNPVETWTFDVCTNTWTRMWPDNPPRRFDSGLVYDIDSAVTIGIASGNVWAYDLEANTWTERGRARTDDLGFYDPVSGLVFAGGWTYDVETDTWTAATWEGDCAELCVYDTSVDRVIKVATREGGATLLLDLRTGAWSRSDAETPDCTVNGWFYLYPAIVYDEAARRTVVAGSVNLCAYDATADRWELLNEPDHSGMVPTSLVVYDPVNRRLLGFGSSIGEIVAFDLVTREWTVLLEPSEG